MPEKFDLVVVGGGGSGLAAAAESAALGASVLLVEKGASLGGSTAWSIGSFTSSDTPHQHGVGVRDDTPERHFRDMDHVNGAAKHPDNLELRKILTDGSPSTFRWLMSLGVQFIGPNPEVHHTRPRMHNVIPGASAYIHYVGRECRRLGVEIRTGTSLAGLLNEGGRVTGVRITGPDGIEKEVLAKSGVVLASGDFSASVPMRARYFAPEVVRAEPVNALNTGEGIAFGEGLGGRIVNGDFGGAYIPKMRFVPPARKSWLLRLPPNRLIAKGMQWGFKYLPPAIVRPFLMRFVTTALGPERNLFENGAALVDSRGRLVKVDLNSLARELALGEDNKGYIILDTRIATKFEAWPNFISTAPNVAYAYLKDYKASRGDVYSEGGTLAELAKQLKVDATELERSVAAHNQTLPEDQKLLQGPYVALGPVRGYITTTNGGLAVNARLQVMGTNGPIDGLYAAGSAGQGGVILGGHGHHIGWAFVSGRHVARTALGAPTDLSIPAAKLATEQNLRGVQTL